MGLPTGTLVKVGFPRAKPRGRVIATIFFAKYVCHCEERGSASNGSNPQLKRCNWQKKISALPLTQTAAHHAQECILYLKSKVNQDGSHYNQAGSHFNQDGSHYNQAGSHFNQDGNRSNQAGSHFRQDGSRSNQAGSHFNQDGSHSNQAGSYFNQDWSHSNQAGNPILIHRRFSVSGTCHFRPCLCLHRHWQGINTGN